MTAPKWYDVTIKKSEISKEVLIKMLEQKKAEKFVIGEEIGDGGYEHWQVRVLFKKPTEMTALIKWNREWGITGHWTPTHVHDFTYCEKEGKFYRSWEGALAKYHDIELLPWQAEIIGAYGAQNRERQITVLIDHLGNHGKTWLSKYMEVNHIADVCPVSSNDAGEYVAYCFAFQRDGYLFDIPRSDTLKGKNAMWRGIEQIKNGLLYDKRYCPKKAWIEPPRMLVLTNEEPPFYTMSLDRWDVWEITSDGILRPWEDGWVEVRAREQLEELRARKSGDP